MFAIVKDGAITQVANSVQKLFSYTVPPGSTPMAEFMISNNVFEVVNAERNAITVTMLKPNLIIPSLVQTIQSSYLLS